MIALRNNLEGQLWQIILDGYGYDCDTHLFLREIRQRGILDWVLQRIENVESDLAFLKHIKGVLLWEKTIRDITLARRILEVLVRGKDRGKYLGPGDPRLRM